MQGAIEDARQTLREMPLFAAAVLMMVALGMGVHAAVFYEADGESLRLVADKSEPSTADETNDPMTRMRARLGCPEKIPGFTLVVGMSHYNLELSVPVRGMQTMFEDARSDVARTLELETTTRIAA
jgi:hypothetical protein